MTAITDTTLDPLDLERERRRLAFEMRNATSTKQRTAIEVQLAKVEDELAAVARGDERERLAEQEAQERAEAEAQAAEQQRVRQIRDECEHLDERLAQACVEADELLGSLTNTLGRFVEMIQRREQLAMTIPEPYPAALYLTRIPQVVSRALRDVPWPVGISPFDGFSLPHGTRMHHALGWPEPEPPRAPTADAWDAIDNLAGAR
jgi:hypothetical protein